MSDKLTSSLQESVLCLLATNDKEGKIASGLLDHRVFDDAYQDIAQRIFSFRKKHGEAPGANHLDDLVDDVVSDTRHKKHKQYVRILEGILHNAESLNAPYVLSRVNEFTKRQRLKSAILQAGEIYQSGKENLIEEVETLLTKALRPQAMSLEVGTFLNDRKKALDFLSTMRADYLTGIPELDARNLGPTSGELLMLLAAKGTGKSWWCVDLGKKCLMQGAKVLHVSLEMSEPRVIQRYYQAFFALGKRSEKYRVTEFEFDKLERIVGFKSRRRRMRMSLDTPGVRRYLRRKMETWGTKLGNLMVASFPMKSLSVAKLEAYLETLELQHNFIPNVLILDYPDLLWMEKKDPRLSLGWTVEEFRGLLQKRNIAGIAPTQTNRKGWDAATVKSSNVSEDASKFRTADMVLIYSRTKQEEAMGLARLYVDKNRNDEDGYSIVISQSYKTGQYVLSSARIHSNYMELVGPADDEEEDED